MNFLAHIYLSDGFDDVMIGNFLGDFVKGRNFEKYNSDIALGIQLHREIDMFTDRHPIVKQSKARLWHKYRHYSSVIMDMYYDHFLAKDWCQYSDIELVEFTERAYMALLSKEDILPPKANRMIAHMVKDNWLLNYAKIEGMQRALTGMSKRTKYDSKMEQAVEDLQMDYALYNEEFHVFFPLLLNHARRVRERLVSEI